MFAGAASTDSRGFAEDYWTLGTSTAQAQRVEVRAVLSNGQKQVFGVFTATALPGPATQITVNAGNNQTATVNTSLATNPSVMVGDRFNNPVRGVAVTFAVATGGGSLTGGNQTTNTAGIATAGRWTLGTTAGPNTLTATATGLSGSPVTFTATGAAGAATMLVFTVQPPGSAPAGVIFAPAVQVTARDALGNTAINFQGNVTVVIASNPGGGTLAGTTTVAVVSGVATFATLSIDKSATGYTLAAVSGGLTPATSAAFVITSGAATQIALNGGNNQSALVNTAVATPPSVIVRDQFNNPVSGVTVTFAVAAGGGSLTGGSQTTDATGIATVGSWTLGPTAEPNTLTATATGLSGSPVTFTATGQVPLTFASVSAGGIFTCGLASAGAAYCWGDNSAGELGDGTIGGNESTPVAVAGGLTFASVTTGEEHSCGLNGVVYCWGWNGYGQLGDGTTTNRLTPVENSTPPASSTVAAGGVHTCALLLGGSAICWGYNQEGQLGDGTTTNQLTGTTVGGGMPFASIATGAVHTCGLLLTPAGVPYCWGSNNWGQLGDATTTNRLSPVAVAGGLMFASVTAGRAHSCGLTPAGAAYCWGNNQYGALGDGTTTNQLTPVAVAGGLTFVSVTAGSDYGCGLTSAGAAYCWGNNQYGELGDGTTTNRVTPVAVTGGLLFTSVTTGGVHTCGLTSAGAAYCWGNNQYGQLGDATTTDRWTPVAVRQ
jgi:alpha-tubulin suppressor-like RCC1 family protein